MFIIGPKNLSFKVIFLTNQDLIFAKYGQKKCRSLETFNYDVACERLNDEVLTTTHLNDVCNHNVFLLLRLSTSNTTASAATPKKR